MSLERHPTIPDLWKARIYTGGRKKDPKTGKPSNKRETYWFEGNEAEARNWYVDLLRGPSSEPVSKIAPTIDQAYPAFCIYYRREVSQTTYYDFLKTYARHIRPVFGQYRPAQLTPGMIEQYKNKRLAETYLPGKRYQLPAQDNDTETLTRKPVSKKRIQNEIYYLAAMVKWMASPEANLALPLTFKITGFRAKEVAARMPVVPARKEIIRLLRHTDRAYRPMLCVWYYGGLRKSELLNMEGERVNLDLSYMIVMGKGSKERIVPIHRKIKIYLRKHWRPGLMWLNPKTKKPYVYLTRVLERAAKRAGISKHIYLHLLRHAFGTHGIESGINPRAMQMLLGHSSMKTTEVYTNLAANFLCSEMDKLGGGPKQEQDLSKLIAELRGALHQMKSQQNQE